jgi:hypothetical protein
MQPALTTVRKPFLVAAALGVLALVLLLILARAGGPSSAFASSHAEAPLISQDPRADNTDLYAFVSPDKTNTVTMIANYIPLEQPASGPNFYSFDDTVLYEIKVDNNGDGRDDLAYQFRFHTATRNPNTFLYNTGPISSLGDPNWNRPQTYSVTLVHFNAAGQQIGKGQVLGSGIPTPPDNIGPRSTPNYNSLAAAAVTNLPGGIKVFAGQRDDPFFVDLGSIFDLAGLRPFNPFHLLPLAAEPGRDALKNDNVQPTRLILEPDDWDLRDREPSEGACPARQRHGPGSRTLGTGLAARKSADQRGRDPARTEGLLEPGGSGRRPAVRVVLHGP